MVAGWLEELKREGADRVTVDSRLVAYWGDLRKRSAARGVADG
jgi:hypothetical protein